MSVRDEWGMACPACGEDDGLIIVARVECRLWPDGTEAEGGHEWEGSSPCRCDCGWTGKVADAEKAGSAEQ